MSTRTEVEFLEEENAELRARVAELEGLLADAVSPTARDFDNAADVIRLHELVNEILDHFGPSGSGHTARVGQVQIAKWRKRAEVEA
jgi:hypothetical protein